jgi:hypothetical protein
MVTVTVWPVPTVSVSGTTVGLCNAPCAGTATATPAGGTAPYTYAWSNGGNTASLSGLCGGTYSVTITDAKGCTVVGSTTIECTPPPPCQNPVVSVTGGGTYCTATTASTVLTASPAGASYVWSPGGATTQTISVNASGTYSVTVTGADYCTGTANASVTFKACCNVTNGGNIGQNQSFCGCVPAGTITFGQGLPTGGAGTIEYMWLYSNTGIYNASNFNQNWFPISGATNATYTIDYELCTTRYFLRCSRRAGCDDWTAGESNRPCVIINPVPTVLVSNTTYICNAPCTGTATAVAGSGTAPYSYSWNTGATTSSLSGLCNGTYSVTVTDAKGCTVVGS